ncbi:hypothetical protein [Sinorhizobium meliloti]|uniref:hypothetical protein n=1 Tax=Rhizobium meliloti TaxID=382 RepID=UPI00209191A6|nr:hypothetical protein [Sinorhizobium meliloti]MCO5966129.1 hypothetical protein [Sinorhizobium meliloti]
MHGEESATAITGEDAARPFGRPDLAPGIFDGEVVPLLKTVPGGSPYPVFEEVFGPPS